MTTTRQGVLNRKRDKHTPQQCVTRSSKHPRTHSESSNPSSWILVLADSTLPWVVLLFSLSVFIPNCSPGIPGGDSGELLAQACQLGTAHPPGIVLA